MGYIYKITNLINGKEYIGQTGLSIEHRFQSHIQAYKRGIDRPLYRAFKKYGVENFVIEALEECPIEQLNDKEIAWIDQENTYANGYNATLGGEGTRTINYQEVFDYWQQGLSAKTIAIKLGKTSTDQIRKILKEVYHISSQDIINRQNDGSSKAIICYSKKQELINTFNSITAAAQWIIDNNYSSDNIRGVAAHIGQCCNEKRKSAYTFIWKYK